MQAPTQFESLEITQDTYSINAWMPVPGFGVLPVNAFLIRASQPTLIDTGLGGLRDDFLARLDELIDVKDLRWIWITHADADHLGNLASLLERAPQARIVTTYLGMGKMGMHGLPVERCYLLNPGERLDLGDRVLTAVEPATFDAPETTGLFDSESRALFTADCFGALLAEPADRAEAIDEIALREGMLGWSQVDAPWLQCVDAEKFARRLERLRAFDPAAIFSSHLPPAGSKLVDTLFANLEGAPEAPPFIGPNQATLEEMTSATAA